MPKTISLRKFVQKLRSLGFAGPYPGGRHFFMERKGHKVRIPNPHQSDLSKNLVMLILHEADISADEWEDA